MPNFYIPAGAVHVFPAGTVATDATLDDLHNVAGNVTYQIGAAPAVTFPMVLHQDAVVVHGVNGQQFTVTNNLPSELLVQY